MLLRAICAGVVIAAASETFGVIPNYTLVGSFNLPTGSQAFDVLPDGSIIALRGGELLKQQPSTPSTFTTIGQIDSAIFSGPFGNFGASFIASSPNGQLLAIGDNNAQGKVHLLDLNALPIDPAVPAPTTAVPNVLSGEAFWQDDQTLFVTGGEFGANAQVLQLDIPVAGPISTRVAVTNINGASGGVTSDGTFLYTANGLENDVTGSRTGEIRAVPLASLPAFGGNAVDFETMGITVARALSGSTLGFDGLGNLLVGGGDFFGGDFGYAGVVDGEAIALALMGGPHARAADEIRLSPESPSAFYGIKFDSVRSELLVTAFGSDVVHRYAIPAPGGCLGLCLAGGLAAAGRCRRAA